MAFERQWRVPRVPVQLLAHYGESSLLYVDIQVAALRVGDDETYYQSYRDVLCRYARHLGVPEEYLRDLS